MIERQGRSLRVAGPIIMSNAHDVLESGLRLLAAGVEEIDFSQVREADSSALVVLLEWLREAGRRKLQARAVNLPEPMKSLAALYGVHELLASLR
ncbi:MAG: STAS domain-containing protein [Burkholderiales bacterium]